MAGSTYAVHDAAHSLSSARPSIVPQLAADEQRREREVRHARLSMKQHQQADAYDGSPARMSKSNPTSPMLRPLEPSEPSAARFRQQLDLLSTENAALRQQAAEHVRALSGAQQARAAALAEVDEAKAAVDASMLSAESEGSQWEQDVAALHERLQRQMDERGAEKRHEAEAQQQLTDDVRALLRVLDAVKRTERDVEAHEQALTDRVQAMEVRVAQADTAAAVTSAREAILQREIERLRAESAEERALSTRERDEHARALESDKAHGERLLQQQIHLLTLSATELECEHSRLHLAMRAQQAQHARAQQDTRAELARALEAKTEMISTLDALETEAERCRVRLLAAQNEAVTRDEYLAAERQRLSEALLAARQEITALHGERSVLQEQLVQWAEEKEHLVKVSNTQRITSAAHHTRLTRRIAAVRVLRPTTRA